MFWPEVKLNQSMELLNLPRGKFGHAVQILTGHNYMARHQFVCGESPVTTCRLCDEGDESSEHILTQCGALQALREKYFGSALVTKEFILNMNLERITAFIEEFSWSLPESYSSIEYGQLVAMKKNKLNIQKSKNGYKVSSQKRFFLIVLSIEV